MTSKVTLLETSSFHRVLMTCRYVLYESFGQKLTVFRLREKRKKYLVQFNMLQKVFKIVTRDLFYKCLIKYCY